MPFDPTTLALIVAGGFALNFGVFLLFAVPAYWVFWVWGRERFAHRRIQPAPLRRAQPWREFKWCVLTFGIYGLALGGAYVFTSLGWTAVYWSIDDYGWFWFVGSIALLAVAHDFWHFFAHWYMHANKWLFRKAHRLHHEFVNPTPFASYALHPYETAIELIPVVAFVFFVPMHPAALTLYITILSFLNVISHLGYEFYPAWVGRFFVTSTHHNLHHSRFNGHYMLYFNLWDRLFGTSFKDYEALHESLVGEHAEPAEASRP